MTSSRIVTDLGGTWDLEILGTTPSSHDVTVPGPWTTQIAGFGDSHETVRYRRTFDAQPSADMRQVLTFGGVNHTAVVSVNGVEVGRNVGAWSRFEVDVTDAVVAGENTLEVVVSYPPRLREGDEPSFLEVPHGKQSWYGTTAGIWQPVALETRHAAHVRSISVHADAASASIEIAAELTDAARAATVRAEVRFAGEVVADGELIDGAATLTVDAPVLWGLDAPNLYDVTVSVIEGADVRDAVSVQTGFRTFEARDGSFFLNGREIELRAVLDQDYHPGSSSIPESTEALEELFRRTRELGFTMLRVHIKRPDPRYYEIADRLGMLVWTELPSWLTWTPAGAEAGLQLLEDFIREDGHHPSIVTWTVINESWGMDQKSAKQRAWLRDAFHRIKAAARGSLVVDNSACRPNFHLETDIDDYHLYRGIPESRREWDALIAEFASRPDWTFTPYGDGVRTGVEPLMLSEFGNWALPHTLDQFEDGTEPWWFGSGADWAFGAGEGTRLLERFRSLGLEDVFGSWEALVEALHESQLVANRYQTTSIRLHPEISGYVLTQLSDVQWEANGLFDMNRAPKRGTAEWGLSNQDAAVALRTDAYSVFGGGAVELTATVIPMRGVDEARPATLRLLADGELVADFAVDATVRSAHTFSLSAALPARAMRVEAELHLDGALLARDAAEILVIDPTDDAGIAVRAADAEVAAWATAQGIALTDDADAVLVTRAFDEAAQQTARDGGRVLVLVEDEHAFSDALDYLPSARLGSRSGDGDWVPRTEWLDRRGAFSTVPGGPILSIAFEDLLGPLVINGIPNAMRSARVHSAIFSGWLRGAATTTTTIAWSEGQVTFTTLRVRAAADVPVARSLAHALVRAAAE
ncbi:sugar-binding domain-containing protein [Salinibacterium sp. ZJ77]|uniref:glycoside hydrolase family 2 protein n=1 Tax=Salinibacterium sp. ZJ77 TaxID=2708337 RepID=UPI00141EC247|nr:sugar-binding domain-containing protein [Salinibacterium sp. ZJ77]